jgi:hypothetical protein
VATPLGSQNYFRPLAGLWDGFLVPGVSGSMGALEPLLGVEIGLNIIAEAAAAAAAHLDFVGPSQGT